MTSNDRRNGYAEVNGLQMYYEVHGAGRPLILLHGAFQTIDIIGPILPALARTRRVIAVEFQAHGRTSDIDRPITYENLADDVSALIEHLDLDRPDVFGFSTGAAAALQLAVRHPGTARKMVVASVSFSSDGGQPELHGSMETITPETFVGTPIEAAYKEVAPNPDDFPRLVERIKQLDATPFAWPEELRGIEAPVMIVVGDADIVRLEHVVEMFRLLGGGAMGDLAGFSKARLAVLPGTSHFIPQGNGLLDRAGWLVPMIDEFLDGPSPEPATEEPIAEV